MSFADTSAPLRLDPNFPALKAVLIVDDDKQLASALQWILEDEGFVVDLAADGEEALLKVEVLEYDVVICDLKMPRLRGDEFFLRAKVARPSLAKRIVFITGHGGDPQIQNFLKAEDVDFLIKPFAMQRLLKRVREIAA